MTARRGPVVDVERLTHSGRLRGPARAVVPVLRSLGVAWQFDSRRTAYLVSIAALDDVEAALTAAGCRVSAMLPGVSL